MRSSRHERLYLADIIEAAESIATFMQGADRVAFAADDLIRSAVLYKLQIIGEAAAHVGEGLRESAAHVPWRQMVGFRNFAVHAYFSVDWEVVWTTATADVPELVQAIRPILASMSPGAGDRTACPDPGGDLRGIPAGAV